MLERYSIKNLKANDVKNWDAVEETIAYNQRQIDLMPYNTSENTRLLEEIVHLETLLKERREDNEKRN